MEKNIFHNKDKINRENCKILFKTMLDILAGTEADINISIWFDQLSLGGSPPVSPV